MLPAFAVLKRCGIPRTREALGIYQENPMQTNTPLADALMPKIRAQYPHESEERHRKRFIEMVRNSDPEVRDGEEPVRRVEANGRMGRLKK